MNDLPRVILVSSENGVGALAERLRMQGYGVDTPASAADAAHLALRNPPAAVVADLWMPGISGVQLCRLLRCEAATEHVPVVLRGPDAQRDRFWAERAGAVAYVASGRMGELARALERAIREAPDAPAFFTELGAGGADVRDRIAAYLDEALFESVLAAEVRALGTCGSFERLFDLFSQFVARVTSYRWLAISTEWPGRFGLHANPATRAQCEIDARRALGVSDATPVLPVEDEDAYEDAGGAPPIVLPITLGTMTLGKLAVAMREPERPHDRKLVSILAREMGGPIRMATLVEESQRLATVDPLTGLKNRRAFGEAASLEVSHAERHDYPVSIVLLDVDHFKKINDQYGHATGDVVLATVGQLLRGMFRRVDVVARWGGEEFVIALSGAGVEGGRVAAEKLREAIAALRIPRANGGELIELTASLGVATHKVGESLDSVVDRADRAMYGAKTSGRNRVVVDAESDGRRARDVADDATPEARSILRGDAADTAVANMAS